MSEKLGFQCKIYNDEEYWLQTIQETPRIIVQWFSQRWRYRLIFQVRLLLVALVQYVVHNLRLKNKKYQNT